MKTIKFFTYAVFVLFFSLALTSCKGDDGADGMDGAVGATGDDGANGQDGNANVQTLTYDISTESGTSILTSVPEFTQSVLENDAILYYLKTVSNVYYSIPGSLVSLNALVISSVGENLIFFQNFEGQPSSISQGAFHTLKIVIIESTGKSAKHSNLQNENYIELKNAGVDIHDYQDVCDYYGINP